MIARLYDFRGGVATTTPPEQTEPNMVATGTNLYYDGALKKRPSWETYCDTAAIDALADDTGTVRGMAAAYINSAWRTVIALDNGSSTSFYLVTNSTTLSSALQTPASAAFTMTAGDDIDMKEFDNKIVCVNAEGADKPAVVYYDGSNIVIQRLEAYDARSRGNDDWYAGQYDASADVKWIDDTTDAQDVGTDDFQLCAANQNGDGFYVAGVLPFTKIVLTNADAFSSEPSDETYQYYAGDGTWTSVTLVSSPTWGTGSGDKTIEFNIPLDSDGELAWKTYGDVDTDYDPAGQPSGALGKYILRVSFVTAPTNTPDCDKLTVSHSQYLTQLFQNDTPDVVGVHGDRCFLASGNVFCRSLGGTNGLKGWSSRDFEYTDEGGNNIIAMSSGEGFLAIIKELGFYRLYGTTTSNAVLRYGGPEGGISTRGACALKDGVAFLGKDGVYYLPPKGDASLITKSISVSPVAGDTLLNWEGNLLFSDPSADTLWWADPDTLRQDDVGDFTMSWWKWTGQNCDCLIYDYSVDSTRQIMAYDGDNGRLVKNGTAAYDTATDTTQTNIECTLQTKYYSFGNPNQKKRYVRVKVDLSKSGNWTLTMISDDGATTSTAYTVASGSGTGHYHEDISIPYTQDGNNIAFKLVNQTANTVAVYGLSVELERRVF